MRKLVMSCLVFNAVNMLIWAIMTPISMITPLRDSVPYIVGVSVWALFSSSFVGAVSCWVALQEEKRD